MTADEKQLFLNGFIKNTLIVMHEGVRTSSEEVQKRILEQCGCSCADHAKSLAQKITSEENDLIKRIDRANKEIFHDKLIFKQLSPSTIHVNWSYGMCICPLIRNDILPSSGVQCNCTRGWVKTIFSVFLKQPVEVEILESYLRGGKKCAFKLLLG